MTTENKNKRAASIDDEVCASRRHGSEQPCEAGLLASPSRCFNLEDSACINCKWCSVWSENPDAENGPGTICYEECEIGEDANFSTPGGCFNWKMK